MELDSSTTRGESRGMGSLLVKKELIEEEFEEELEPNPIEFFDPLEAEFTTLGLI